MRIAEIAWDQVPTPIGLPASTSVGACSICSSMNDLIRFGSSAAFPSPIARGSPPHSARCSIRGLRYRTVSRRVPPWEACQGGTTSDIGDLKPDALLRADSHHRYVAFGPDSQLLESVLTAKVRRRRPRRHRNCRHLERYRDGIPQSLCASRFDLATSYRYLPQTSLVYLNPSCSGKVDDYIVPAIFSGPVSVARYPGTRQASVRQLREQTDRRSPMLSHCLCNRLGRGSLHVDRFFR